MRVHQRQLPGDRYRFARPVSGEGRTVLFSDQRLATVIWPFSYLKTIGDEFQIESKRFARSFPNPHVGSTRRTRFSLMSRPKLRSQTPRSWSLNLNRAKLWKRYAS